MKTQTITLSKTSAILKCCAIVLFIACVVSAAGKVSIQEFFHNILEWQSI